MVKSADIVTVPINPEHCAKPLTESMLTPEGAGCVEPGIPMDHWTGTASVIGAMLKFPVAVNCT
jgi:hypothetical protein